MKRLSIKFRITFWFALFMTLSIFACFFFLSSEGGRLVEQQSSAVMVELVQQFANEIEWEDGRFEFDEDFEVHQQSVYLSAYEADGTLLYGWVPEGYSHSEKPSPGKVTEIEQDGESWYVYTLQYVPEGGTKELTLLAVTHSAGPSAVFAVLRTLSIAIFPAILLTAVIGGYLIACRAFRPVKKIIQTAEQISHGDDLSARINLPESRDEIHTLALAFDEMFDRLEQAFENEKRFTSDVSHELRTPTAVILSQCEYALENAQTLDEAKESLQKIAGQAGKMSAMIAQLLLLARGESRQTVLQKECVDLSMIAEIVCDQQREAAWEKEITLHSDIAPALSVMADETMLMRLLINLMDNSIKYGKAGGNIYVSLKAEGDRVVGCIRDDGIGIAEEHLPFIWNRFFQVDPARDPNREGTGLGLPLVKWIVEAHGGSIAVQSRLGEGTAFTFELPNA